MGLTYQSTRGDEKEVTASMAILQGLAKDGGLFMPPCTPQLDVPLEKLVSMTYRETMYKVMKLSLIDYTEKELRDHIARAYDGKLDTEEITPLIKADGAYYLESYHGSTIVFKDMALSVLSHLVVTAAGKSHVNREIVTLMAISGDTSKVAMAKFVDVPGTRIIVLYPKDGASKIQELQMRARKGDSTSVVAIHSNFGDAQTGVRRMFGDKDLEAELMGKGFRFSSTNSVSVGRLVPQIVCYVYAHVKLLEAGEIKKSENISVVVFTGSFGNILAAYFAKRMGFPVKTLVCAPNDSKVLHDFFTTGIYDRKREFILTNSPSVDILIFSNLKCLVYMSTGCDTLASGNLMRGLSQEGRYEVTPEMRALMSDFVGGFATQEQNTATIKKLFDNTGYLIDTHTGVVASVYGDYGKESGNDTKTVIASTVSLYKFPYSVMEAIAGREGLEDRDKLEIVGALSALSSVAVSQAVEEVCHATVRHNREYGVDDMKSEVKDILGIS